MKSLKLPGIQRRFYLFLLLVCICTTANLKAQVVVDWNKGHMSDNIDYIGSDGGDWSATIVDGNHFRVTKKANHVDNIIHYISFDRKEWTARLNGDKFVHTPNGPWGNEHEDIRMDYIASDNSECSATIIGDNFIITNRSNGQQPYQSQYLYYITWNSSHWTAELAKPNFQHWEGIAENVVKITPNLNYLTWNRTKWTASITSDGVFTHTDENGISHSDVNIVYLNYDGSIWGATLVIQKFEPAPNGPIFGAPLVNQKFKHAPGFVPENRSSLDRFFANFRNIDIHGGFPENQPSSGTATGEFRGIIVKEENAMLYYRPVDNMGVCTNDLNWLPSAKVISRSKIGSCLNLGQQRDIYSFIYKK